MRDGKKREKSVRHTERVLIAKLWLFEMQTFVYNLFRSVPSAANEIRIFFRAMSWRSFALCTINGNKKNKLYVYIDKFCCQWIGSASPLPLPLMMSSRSSHRHHLCPHWTETRWVCLLICTQLIIIEFLLSPHSSRNHFLFYAAARCVFIVIILTQSKNGKWRAKKKSFSSVSIGWQNSIKFLCRTGWKKKLSCARQAMCVWENTNQNKVFTSNCHNWHFHFAEWTD